MADRDAPQAQNYRSYVGPTDRYDFMGASQFRLLTSLGLRANSRLLDFGCGSLRAGKLLIPYLDAGNYFGLDPNKWLIEEGINKELGSDIVRIKKPTFAFNDDFFVPFQEKFDFVVAQSIFSHTDLPTMKKGLSALLSAMKDSGIAIFTVIEGPDYEGAEQWRYPGCTTHSPSAIKKSLRELRCHWRRLDWFHPGQTWFVMTKNRSRLPSALDAFLLLGGEEIGSEQYKSQGFWSNRLSSLKKRFSQRSL